MPDPVSRTPAQMANFEIEPSLQKRVQKRVLNHFRFELRPDEIEAIETPQIETPQIETAQIETAQIETAQIEAPHHLFLLKRKKNEYGLSRTGTGYHYPDTDVVVIYWTEDLTQIRSQEFFSSMMDMKTVFSYGGNTEIEYINYSPVQHFNVWRFDIKDKEEEEMSKTNCVYLDVSRFPNLYPYVTIKGFPYKVIHYEHNYSYRILLNAVIRNQLDLKIGDDVEVTKLGLKYLKPIKNLTVFVDGKIKNHSTIKLKEQLVGKPIHPKSKLICEDPKFSIITFDNEEIGMITEETNIKLHGSNP